MTLIVPFHQEGITPLNFPGGTFIEDDEDEDMLNTSLEYQDDIPAPDDDAAPGSMAATSRQLSHRNSEVVLVEPAPAEEEVKVEVIEVGSVSYSV